MVSVSRSLFTFAFNAHIIILTSTDINLKENTSRRSAKFTQKLEYKISQVQLFNFRKRRKYLAKLKTRPNLC